MRTPQPATCSDERGWICERFEARYSVAHGQAVAMVLKKILMLIQRGGLIFRTGEGEATWQYWQYWKMPLASALSQGGRVIIQYPGDTVWDWLGEGLPTGTRLYRPWHSTTSLSDMSAVLHTRLGASHSLAEPSPQIVAKRPAK